MYNTHALSVTSSLLFHYTLCSSHDRALRLRVCVCGKGGLGEWGCACIIRLQEVAARYPEEDVQELSHSAEGLPQNDNYVEDEPSHHSSWQHGSLSSQSSLPIFSIFFPSPRSKGGRGGIEGWRKGLEFQQFHFLARGFNIIFNLPCLITNMKLSAPAGANLGRNRTMCSSGCNFATSC